MTPTASAVVEAAIPSAIEPPLSRSVPPPAPSSHPWRDAIVVAAFAIAIATPLLLAFRPDASSTMFEKRSAAPWPRIARLLTDRAQATRDIEAAFGDRFGGRDLLILAHHGLLALGLHVSPVPKVLMGRDGWLYFRGEDLQAIDRDYRGLVHWPAEQPVEIAAELDRRRAFLATRGIPYFVLIAPDKATVYPEHLPSWISRARRTRLDALHEALDRYPKLNVIDPRPALAERKREVQVYYRTDSHWNYEGALVAYDLLMNALRRAGVAVPHTPARRPPYEPGDVYSGDLAQLLRLPKSFAEDDRVPFHKVVSDAERGCARPISDPVEPVVYGCARAELPRALVYRDSMLDAMIPPLSENFSRVVYLAGHRMRAEDIAREQPDVVIEEFVERSMHALIAERMP